VTPPPDDLALLRVQAAASLDARDRIAGCYGATIATCRGGQALWIGAEVPDALAHDLAAAVETAPPAAQPEDPPPALGACAAILTAAIGAPLPVAAGPSYVIPPDLRLASDAAIVCSGEPGVDRLRRANPGNWHPVEWDELLDGRLGPWTIAVDGDRAVSICHTPGPLTDGAGECGVWTEPAFRRRGLAAATAARWVALVRSGRRRLFYSTDFANRSSQRVAARLGLRAIGATWRLHAPKPPPDPRVHPLCSLYRAR
jgi:hypothetical protein